MDTIFGYLLNISLSLLACFSVFLSAPLIIHTVQSILKTHSRLKEYLAPLGRPQCIDRVFGVVAFTALFGLIAQSVRGYNAFGSYPDFGYFDGTLNSSLQSGSIPLADRRFNFLVVALVPLYALWRDPRILLILQSIGLALTAFPLYWYGRRQVGRLLALTVTIAYLVSPLVQALNQPAFYEIKLAVPLLAFATFLLLRERHGAFLICLAPSLLLKQEISFIAVGFAAFVFFVQRKRVLGATLAAAGVGLAVFIVMFLYPSLTGGKPYPTFGERYAYLGQTLEQVILTLIRRPDLVAEHVLIPDKIAFFLHLLTPVALLPLVGLEVTAIALPPLAYTLLSDLPQQFDPNQYYQAPLVPFVFFGAIKGLERLLRAKSPPRGNPQNIILLRKTALVALLFVSSQLYLLPIWLRILNPSNLTLDQHNELGHRLIQLIPSNAGVAAQTEFYMPLYAQHRNSVVEFGQPYAMGYNPSYLFGDSTRTWYNYHKSTWEYWRASGYFETVVEQDGYFLLRRRQLPAQRTTLENGWIVLRSNESPNRTMVDNGWGLLGYASTTSSFTRPLGFQFGDEVTLLGYAPVPSSTMRGGHTLRVVVEWRAERKIGKPYVTLAHLIDSRGHVWAQEDREPIYGIIPPSSWDPGDIMRDQYTFELPVTMPPGDYRLEVGIWDPDAQESLEIKDAHGQELGNRAIIGDLRVEKETTNVPAGYLMIEQPFYVDMAEVRFLGSTSIPQTLTPGDELQVGLYWRAREKPRGDYAISIQLRDANGRAILAQTDRPAGGAYPTTQWQIGEVLLDWHDLIVPTNFASGNYELAVVLRRATDGGEIGKAKIGEIIVAGK